MSPVINSSFVNNLECRRSHIQTKYGLAKSVDIAIQFSSDNPQQILASLINRDNLQSLLQSLHRKITFSQSINKNLELTFLPDSDYAPTESVTAQPALMRKTHGTAQEVSDIRKFEPAPDEMALLALASLLDKARRSGLDLSEAAKDWKHNQKAAYDKLTGAERDVLSSLASKPVRTKSLEIFLDTDSILCVATYSSSHSQTKQLAKDSFSPKLRIHSQEVIFNMDDAEYLPANQYHPCKDAIIKLNDLSDRKAVAGLNSLWRLNLSKSDRENLSQAIILSERSVLIDHLVRLKANLT